MVRNNREEWKTYGNVFDQFTNRLLFKMAGQGFFEELKHTVAIGKEANVFIADKEDGFVAVKIYRLENCNFNKMHQYIRQDPRYIGLSNSRRKTIFSWAQREFRNLLKAREVIRVPTPIIHKEHVVVMELIGHGNEPSPLLKDSPPENPEEFTNKIIENIKVLWHEAKLVHGDLSEFNIINHDEEPIFIDFSQSTVTESHDALELLERDIFNLCRYFKKLGIDKDYKKLLDYILK